MPHHTLDRSVTVDRWNHAYPPRLTVAPGDTVELQMHDSTGGQFGPASTTADLERLDRDRIHALTGPVAVEGAEPGDRLVLDILGYEHEGWAWTGVHPGRALLPDDFSEPLLQVWELEETVTRSLPGLAIPLAPFCGILGVQPAEPGEHRTRAPGVHGGNLDVRHLIAGSRLHLPVLVPGAGLCAGDAHAAQGDGEVCLNGMEAPMTVRLRVDLVKKDPLPGPFLETPHRYHPPASEGAGWWCWIESDPDPRAACQRVVRRAIDHLTRVPGLSPEQAYIACSVALHLSIAQLVNDPVTTITGAWPRALLT